MGLGTHFGAKVRGGMVTGQSDTRISENKDVGLLNLKSHRRFDLAHIPNSKAKDWYRNKFIETTLPL